MKKLIIIISYCILLLGISEAQAQIGKIKSLGKSVIKEKEDQKISEKQTQEAKGTETEVQQPSSQKLERDADGYVINDPAIIEYLKNKTIYYFTNYSTMYSCRDCRIVGIVANKTNDTLQLVEVYQKKYQSGLNKDELAFTKLTDGPYKEQYKEQYLYDDQYALMQNDGSILICEPYASGDRIELLSKDSNAVKTASKEEVLKKGQEYLKKTREARAEKEEQKRIAENENYFKSGDVKAYKHDAGLETQFLKILNSINTSPAVEDKYRASYKKILLVSTDWYIKKNDIDQPLKMVYGAWAIGNYTQSKNCFFHKVYFKKDYLGGGKYSDIKYDESQKPSIGSCDIIK